MPFVSALFAPLNVTLVPNVTDWLDPALATGGIVSKIIEAL